jgi:hypothetical protein
LTSAGGLEIVVEPDLDQDGDFDFVGFKDASRLTSWIENTSYVTLDDISDLTVAAGASEQTVVITGIGSNRTGGSTLRITATSSDNQLVTAPVVTYSPPDSTGSVSFAPAPVLAVLAFGKRARNGRIHRVIATQC